MADAPGSLDELLAQHGGGEPATLDELLARHPAANHDWTPPGDSAYAEANAPGPLVQSTSVGRVLDAFGHGTIQGFGEESSLNKDFRTALRSATENQSLLTRAFRDGVLIPAATAVDTGYRAFGAVIHGGQAAVTQLGEETGQQSLARDIAALPEAFPLFGTELGGFHPQVPPYIAKARELGVIGEGEAGWKGTAVRSAEDQKAIADRWVEAYGEHNAKQLEEAPTGPPAAEPAPALQPSDIHSAAREIAPDTFKEYDALQQRKETFRRWIDDLAETRANDPRVAEMQGKIDTILEKVGGNEDRLTKAAARRLDEARSDLESFLRTDTPDMQRVRRELQATDYKMRDLAPEVSAAYREAETRFPAEEPAPAEAATAPEAVAPADVAPRVEEAPPAAPAEAAAPREAAAQPETAPAPKAAPVNIAKDVTRKLTAAGRPTEEAQAAAALVQAHYEARAARFGGAKGTAGELYRKEAPEIRAGRGAATKTSELELAQVKRGKIRISEGRNVITLMKDADASTFIHETGHQWLEELMSDAKDVRAPADLLQDAKTVRDWLGVKDGEAIPTKAHEKFARGFERYMMEGVAPSRGLAKVFAQFKDWLTKIYQTVNRLKAPINDDIRGVLDRMLAANPEKTVIASEVEPGKTFADIHEADAEATPPAQAHPAAELVRGERDSIAATQAPEIHDALPRAPDEPLGERAGTRPASDGHGDAGRSLAGEAGAGAQPGALGAGGGEAPAQGVGARPETKPVRQKTPYLTVPKEPTRLVSYLRKIGGLKDEGGELKQILGGKTRGLVRENGMSLDDAALKAWEDGYLPGGSRPDIQTLLNAIDEDFNRKPRYSEKDDSAVAGYQAALAHNTEVDRLADKLGLDIGNMTGSEFFAEVRKRLSEDEAAKIAESQAQAYEHDLAEAERLAKEWVEAQGDAYEPEIAPARTPATLEDLENERRQEESARGQQAGAGAAPAPGDAGQRQGGGEAGARPRASGAGTDRPAGPNDSFGADTSRVDKAGNIVLDNLATTEDVKQVIRDSAARNNDYIDARRGVVSDAQALSLADAMGVDVERLNLRQIGEAWNKEQIFWLEKLLIQASTAVRDAMKAGDEAGYAQAALRFQLVQETVQSHASGVRAEAGRALQAFAALKKMAGRQEALDMGKFLEENTGKTLFQLREEMELGQHLETPAQTARFVSDVNRTGWQKARAGILGYFINNLISGPITHAGYSIGNTVWSLFKATADTSAAAAIGAFREAMTGKPVDRVYFGEVGAQLYGMTRGIRDGVAPAGVALRTGVSYMKGAEAAGQGMLPLGEAALRPQAIPGKVGYVLETPSRSVSAIHTLFYGMNYEAEIARVAYRTAVREGLEVGSPEFNTRVARMTESPAPEVMSKAHDEALKSVLMKAPPFGSGQYNLQKAVNSNILAKLVMPFMQVGANILHEGYVEHTPLGPMVSQPVRDNLAGRNGAVARDSQMARIGVGIGLGTAVLGLTAEGILTDAGPTDREALHAKEMTGWKPYSIKVGEWYIPHRKYLGPLGPLIGGISDIYAAGHALSTEGAGKAALGAVFGLAAVVADESWMKGLANFIDAARHWDRDGEKYLRNLAMDFLPFSVGMGQVAHVIDPYRREVHSWTDAARAHIPGLSQGLYPMRDIFGEPMPGGVMMSPSKAVHDPIIDAFQKIDQFPAKMERAVRGVNLTDRQYDDLAKTAGENVRQRLYPLVTMPGFDDLPLGIRRKMMMDAVHSARENARDLIMMENPSVITAATDAKQAAITGPKRKRVDQVP